MQHVVWQAKRCDVQCTNLPMKVFKCKCEQWRCNLNDDSDECMLFSTWWRSHMCMVYCSAGLEVVPAVQVCAPSASFVVPYTKIHYM